MKILGIIAVLGGLSLVVSGQILADEKKCKNVEKKKCGTIEQESCCRPKFGCEWNKEPFCTESDYRLSFLNCHIKQSPTTCQKEPGCVWKFAGCKMKQK
jgi:hypothetical protein